LLGSSKPEEKDKYVMVRLRVIALLCLVAGCGTSIESTSSGRGDSAASAESGAKTTEVRVAELQVAATVFADVFVADYVLSNLEHRRLVGQCLDDAGFPGVDLGDSVLITPEMLTSNPTPIRWSFPPQGVLSLPSRTLEGAEAAAAGQSKPWTPPSFPTAEEGLRFEASLAECDNSQPYPSSMESLRPLEVEAAINDVAEQSMRHQGFAKLDAAYRTCLQQEGVQEVTYQADGIVMDGASGELARKVDGRCRGPLYGDFIALRSEDWEELLVEVAPELERYADQWSAIVNAAAKALG
jgi:hypothetical protein